MYLFIEMDGNKKLTEDEIDKAFFSYMKNLLDDYTKYDIKVCVTFDSDYSQPKISGYILDDDPDLDYYIWIRKSMNRKQQLITMAHECVHLKQMLKNELSSEEMRKAETLDDSAYWDDPREIEAFGRELGLYVKYIKLFGIEV